MKHKIYISLITIFTLLISCKSNDDIIIKIQISDIPSGRYQVVKLSHAATSIYGPLNRIVTIEHRNKSMIINNLKDASTLSSANISYGTPVSSGNLSFSNASKGDNGIIINLFACYIGEVQLKKIKE